MKKFFSWTMVILLFAVFLGLCFVQYTVPDRYGEKYIPSLDHNVKVRFDKYGIPHIKAKTDRDAYRVLGFIMASDRLFQMDLLRRTVNGELSEVFGKDLLDTDKMLRRLRLKKHAEFLYEKYNTLENQKPYSLAQAFLAGVHDFIETQPLPLEFSIMGYTPQKFTVAEIIGVTGYMALTFAEGVNSDVLNYELINKLPPEKLELLRTGDKVDYDYFGEKKIVHNQTLKNMNKALSKLNEIVPQFHGSNSWVLAGHRSKSGFPILANDPHIATSNPHIFYEAHIKSPSLEVYGNFIPLIPFPVMGHTPYSAWGLTMAEVDDLTIYEERFNPENKNQVMFNNEWVDVETYEEEIKVKGGKTETIEVTLTPHGPILDEKYFNLGGSNLSLNWSYHHPENNVLKTVYQFPLAKTVEQFKDAVSHAAAPGLNISWVNKTGDIAWWVMGKFPKLPEGVPYDMVLKGWDGTQEVERFYSTDENPHLVNPENGVIVSANYRPQQEEFAHFDGYWQPAGRYFRLQKLLSAQEKWNLEELKSIQTDTIVPVADRVVERLKLALKTNDLTQLEQVALEHVKNWDFDCKKDSTGCLIYHEWLYQIIINIFKDELSEEEYKKLGNIADLWHSTKKLLNDFDHSFWDNIETDQVENANDIITLSFLEAVENIEEKFGKRVSLWKWGRMHTVEYKHPFGKQFPLNLIYNIGPVKADGGRYVINNIGHKVAKKGFEVVHAPATRRLIDMANPKRSLGVIPTGVSGNPFSNHFSDQLELYHKSEYREQVMDFSGLDEFSLMVFKTKEN